MAEPHPMVVAPIDFEVFLFLLPGGRPRRLAVISAIQDGGRPRLRPRPLARRSRLKIASSICSRSCRNSTRILATSIWFPPQLLVVFSLAQCAEQESRITGFTLFYRNVRRISSANLRVIGLKEPESSCRTKGLMGTFKRAGGSNKNKRAIRGK